MSRVTRWLRARADALAVLAIILSVGGANLWWTSHQTGQVARAQQTAGAAWQKAAAASEKAALSSATQVIFCRSLNASRADQTGLWEFILHLSGPPRTARERAVLARFEHHLHVVFAPRNCHVISSQKGAQP